MADDLTLYFWHRGNPEYPNGHAAYRVRLGNRETLSNYDDPEDLDLRKVRFPTLVDRRKAQKHTEQQQQVLISTAPVKVKLPIIGSDSGPWGLWREAEYGTGWYDTLTAGSVRCVSNLLFK